MWERHRDRFVFGLVGAVLTVIMVVLTVPCVVIGSLYLDIGRAGAVAWFGVISLVSAVAVMVTVSSTRGAGFDRSGPSVGHRR